MSKLTYKVKHNADLSSELKKAKNVALFAIKTRSLSSKDVKQFGLKSIIANQVLRKYSRNKKCKQVRRVKLTIPNQGLLFKDKSIRIPSLKLIISFDKIIEKINQVELDDTYAYICCSVVDDIQYKERSCIGVDLNATGHIAVASIDDKVLKLGKEAPHIHRVYQSIRRKAQKNRTYKFIKKIKNKESRKIRDINHKISRKIVDIAKIKNYAIKLENLTGIRKKKQGKKVNGIKSNWSFYQLQQFIEYKSKLLGVPVFYVDPQYTSQRCSRCGLIGTREKKMFRCICGHNDHADANASFNIAKASIMHGNLNIDRDIFKSNTDIAQVEMMRTTLTTEPTML